MAPNGDHHEAVRFDELPADRPADRPATTGGAEDRVRQLEEALETRTVIARAQGILMERYGLDGDQAFRVLRRVSNDTNVPLRGVAQHLIETRRLPDQ